MNTIKYIEKDRNVEIIFNKETKEIISWNMPLEYEDTEIEEEFSYARLEIFG